MAFVPAVPEAAAGGITLGEVIIALAAALGWVACYGLLHGWNYTIGFLLRKLGDALDFTVLRVHVDLGAPVRDLDNSVQAALSAGVSTFDHAMGLFFHWAGVMLAWMVNFAAASAQDTLRFAEWLTGAHLPKWLKAALYVAFPPALLARLIKAAVANGLPHTTRVVVTKTIEHVTTKVVKVAKAVAHPATVALPGIRKEITGLTKRNLRIAKRLHRVEALLGATAMALAMANVLGVRASCLRGQGNVARLLRHICGVPRWLLDLLILGTVEAFIAADLCDFSDLLIKQAKLLQPALMEFVTVEDALVKCSGVTDLYKLDLPPLSLPPMPAYPALSV